MQYAGMQYVKANMQCAAMQYGNANMQNAGMQYVNMQYVNANMQYVSANMQYASMQYVNIHTACNHGLNMHLPTCSCRYARCKCTDLAMYSHRQRNINLSARPPQTPPSYMITVLISLYITNLFNGLQAIQKIYIIE